MGHIAKGLQVEYIAADDLAPYENNARTHSDEQVSQIVRSIEEFGWTNPILIDEAGGIIAGHGRLMAARRLGMESVPCIRLAGLDDAQRRALILADNKLALNAGWDFGLLAGELQALIDAGFDAELTGFGADEIDEIIAEALVAAWEKARPEARERFIADIHAVIDHPVMDHDDLDPGDIPEFLRRTEGGHDWRRA